MEIGRLGDVKSIGVDLAGILGRRMASAEGGSVPNGVGVWGGVFPLQPTRGLESVVSFPSRVRGRAPAENGFWRIFRPQNAPFCIYMTKILGGGQFALASPYSKFWGLVPPSSVIYAHG